MKKIFAIIPAIFLVACAGNDEFDYSKKSDTDILNEGIEHLKNENYVSAVNSLTQLEYNHPYSSLVANSWYLAGYGYYRDGKYAEAVDQFSKLLKFQPSHPQAPYVAYMIAISYYDQISPITRDQKMTERALKSMLEVVQKYPNTKYAEDLKPKIIIARNNLAAKEMYIAKTLEGKKNIIAALNRYQTVIKKYETTLFVPEALFRAVEIYDMMGERDEVKNMTRLLQVNYPNTRWYRLAKRIADK